MSDLLIYLAYRAASGVLAALPERVIRRLGTVAGRLSWWWARDRKAMAVRHMRRVLGDADESAIRRAAREMFAAYGRYWAEVLWFRPRRFEEALSRVTLVGSEHVREAQARRRPIIAALPHIGNWEMAATTAREMGLPVTAVAEALANRRLSGWFTEMRAQLSIEAVLAEGPASMRAVLAALREGRLVALVSDRNIGVSGVEVEFFGEGTALPAGPAVLALRTGAVLLPCASYFKPGAGHRVVVLPPVAVPDRGVPGRAASMTQELAHRFEELVRSAPTQWHLVQPNWPSDLEFLAAGRGRR